MSGDADKAYFADGMTEDLITDLSKVAGLVVIARNSTFQYKGKAHDVREIGKALERALRARRQRAHAAATASASTRSSSTRRRARTCGPTATTASSRTSSACRTRSRATSSKALSVELTKDESDRVAKRGTGNVQAYDVVLKGWEHYLQADAGRVQGRDRRLQEGGRDRSDLRSRAYAALAAIHWEIYTRYWGPALGLSRDTQARRRAVSRQGDARSRRRSRTRSRARCSCSRSSTRRRSPRRSARSRAIRTTPTATSRSPAR